MMIKKLLLMGAAIAPLLFLQDAEARKSPGHHSVKGYYRKDGTYVSPHTRGSGPLASGSSSGGSTYSVPLYWGLSPSAVDSPPNVVPTPTPFAEYDPALASIYPWRYPRSKGSSAFRNGLKGYGSGLLGAGKKLSPPTGATPPSVAVETPETLYRIEPGQGIEILSLGDSIVKAHGLFGPPQQVFSRGVGLTEEVWEFPLPVQFNGTELFRCVFKDGGAIQIKVRSPYFLALGNISPFGSAPRCQLQDASKQSGILYKSSCTYPDSKRPVVFNYYDDIVRGISFQADSNGYVGNDAAINAIVVHPVEKPVLADHGAVTQLP